MTIFSGWREQYERMLRSREHLVAVASGQLYADSDQARDALVHFVQDAYHLKDWLKNDPGVVGSIIATLEMTIYAEPDLAVCADLANGAKHFRLTSTKTGDLHTAVTGQSVTVRPGTVGARTVVPAAGSAKPQNDVTGPLPALHSWVIQSNGRAFDALSWADQVVVAWTNWLRGQQLLP